MKTKQNFAKNFGLLLRLTRQNRCETLVDLAGSTGLSVSFLSQIETGKIAPSINSILKILQHYGCSLLVQPDGVRFKKASAE